jgi:hypothetical protein
MSDGGIVLPLRSASISGVDIEAPRREETDFFTFFTFFFFFFGFGFNNSGSRFCW